MVVFAPHNLLGDPPFSRLDLISCRNLLIYLDRDVQRDVVELFHYALNPDGTLLLGSAETDRCLRICSGWKISVCASTASAMFRCGSRACRCFRAPIPGFPDRWRIRGPRPSGGAGRLRKSASADGGTVRPAQRSGQSGEQAGAFIRARRTVPDSSRRRAHRQPGEAGARGAAH